MSSSLQISAVFQPFATYWISVYYEIQHKLQDKITMKSTVISVKSSCVLSQNAR